MSFLVKMLRNTNRVVSIAVTYDQQLTLLIVFFIATVSIWSSAYYPKNDVIFSLCYLVPLCLRNLFPKIFGPGRILRLLTSTLPWHFACQCLDNEDNLSAFCYSPKKTGIYFESCPWVICAETVSFFSFIFFLLCLSRQLKFWTNDEHELTPVNLLCFCSFSSLCGIEQVIF